MWGSSGNFEEYHLTARRNWDKQLAYTRTFSLALMAVSFNIEIWLKLKKNHKDHIRFWMSYKIWKYTANTVPINPEISRFFTLLQRLGDLSQDLLLKFRRDCKVPMSGVIHKTSCQSPYTYCQCWSHGDKHISKLYKNNEICICTLYSMKSNPQMMCTVDTIVKQFQSHQVFEYGFVIQCVILVFENLCSNFIFWNETPNQWSMTGYKTHYKPLGSMSDKFQIIPLGRRIWQFRYTFTNLSQLTCFALCMCLKLNSTRFTSQI